MDFKKAISKLCVIFCRLRRRESANSNRIRSAGNAWLRVNILAALSRAMRDASPHRTPFVSPPPLLLQRSLFAASGSEAATTLTLSCDANWNIASS